MERNWLELLQQKNQIDKVMEANRITEKYGLALTEQEASLVVSKRNDSLKEKRRVEFGQTITPKIIFEFCDSAYIDQNNYVESLIRLQDIFYLYKNEMLDEISDDELLHFMKEQFETVCFGDLDYLEGTCLSIFAEAIRSGYDGYKATEGFGEFTELDEVARWDPDLYMETVKELFWG